MRKQVTACESQGQAHAGAVPARPRLAVPEEERRKSRLLRVHTVALEAECHTEIRHHLAAVSTSDDGECVLNFFFPVR